MVTPAVCYLKVVIIYIHPLNLVQESEQISAHFDPNKQVTISLIYIPNTIP